MDDDKLLQAKHWVDNCITKEENGFVKLANWLTEHATTIVST